MRERIWACRCYAAGSPYEADLSHSVQLASSRPGKSGSQAADSDHAILL